MRHVLALALAAGLGYAVCYFGQGRGSAGAVGGPTDLAGITGITVVEPDPETSGVTVRRYDVKRVVVESETVRQQTGWDDPGAVRISVAGYGRPVVMWAAPGAKE